jgi:hypothetical protein
MALAKSGDAADAVGGACPPQKCFLTVLKNVQNTENTLKYDFFNPMLQFISAVFLEGKTSYNKKQNTYNVQIDFFLRTKYTIFIQVQSPGNMKDGINYWDCTLFPDPLWQHASYGQVSSPRNPEPFQTVPKSSWTLPKNC